LGLQKKIVFRARVREVGMALVQVTITAVLVFDDERTNGPGVDEIIELFEPPEPGGDMVVPVLARVTSAQPYLGVPPPELGGAALGEELIVVPGQVGRS
jgi:hypothetical protein